MKNDKGEKIMFDCDNIIEEPSGNSTEFGIGGLIALLACLAFAGEPTDKIPCMTEQRSDSAIKKCIHQELPVIRNYQITALTR